MTAAVLTCSDPLAPRRPDRHFAAEAAAAVMLGGHTALVDHDALLAGDARAAVARVPRDFGPVWYRGWMIPSRHYVVLADALEERGTVLHTSPAQYRAAHELPGWYRTFARVTPRSAWLPLRPRTVPGEAALASLATGIGTSGTGGSGSRAAVVKDYVKSRKHEWNEASFVPDTADTARMAAVVRRFVELQEDSLAGGIVLRSFERFTGEEARVWWVNGEAVQVTAHPDTPRSLPSPSVGPVAPLVRALDCPFVTTDMALREDGTWRVVEVGDGQVSGFPEGTDPRRVLQALIRTTQR